jgi:hypothetical protein
VCHIAGIYLVADGWYWLCVGTARQAADPGVRLEMPSRVAARPELTRPEPAVGDPKLRLAWT